MSIEITKIIEFVARHGYTLIFFWVLAEQVAQVRPLQGGSRLMAAHAKPASVRYLNSRFREPFAEQFLMDDLYAFESSRRRARNRGFRPRKALGLPRVAIGGITPDNGGPLIDAGADYLAVISAVFGDPDVRGAASRYAHLITSHREMSR